MKWPYNLIDWEWDVMANGGGVEDAVKYAQEHNVKSLLWYELKYALACSKAIIPSEQA